MKIGFIGLGMMGGGMSANLLKAGHTVVGYDLNPASMERHVKAGGIAAASAQEAAAHMDVVITMLPNGALVESALFGPQGFAESMSPNTLYIDSSTIQPHISVSLSERLQAMGIPMLDAPVGRTSNHAWAGTLIFLVGGTAENLERARPLLECMGDTVQHCGPAGAGIRTKIVNNYMSITLNVLTAEALTLAEKFGLERDKVIEVLMGTPAGRSHLTTSYPTRVFKNDVSPTFMIDLAAKDLGLALEAAAAVHVPLSTGAAAHQMYSIAQAEGRGREDWSAMLLAIRELANIQQSL
ncbi:MAG: sulfolactaldehyde 3-reductase [Desulfovibrionaceae bacterium]